MDLFTIGLFCAAITAALFYREQRGSQHDIAELPTALVAIGMLLRLTAALLIVTAVALSVGAL